jgi:DNA-binding NarL/FixJ family response regulator
MQILVAVNHLLFREGLKLLLQQMETPELILEAENLVAAKLALMTHPELDLAIIENDLPAGADALVLDDLISSAATIPCIVMMNEYDSKVVRHAMNLGALGVIVKNASGAVIHRALQTVLTGGIYVPQPSERLTV